MSIRTSMFALAAIATLSGAALAPTSASALGFGGHFGGSHFGGHFGGEHLGGHFGWRFGGRGWGHGFGYDHWAGNHGPHICPLGAWCPPLPHPQPYPPYPRGPHFGPGFGGGVAYGSGPRVSYSGIDSAPAGAPAPSGGCLTKQELPDGSAVFRDLCTQEQAESPPQGGPSGR
jgi:hypothetical protein